GALHQLVTLQVDTSFRLRPGVKPPPEASRPERRALIDWCVRFAKLGPWRSIRSYRVWTSLGPDPGGVVPRVEGALRGELVEQVDYRPLLGMTQTKFARLCEQYRVGEPGGKAQGVRVVVLDHGFLDGLLPVANGTDAPSGGGEQATPEGG